MSSKKWLVVAAGVLLPIAAFAQEKQTSYIPTDAHAPVTATNYESAFKGYRTASEEGNTPDKAWRFANEEMGKLGGHMGQIKEGTASPSQSGAADHSKHH